MKKKLIFLLLVSPFFPLAAHAYAGPGVAIGAVVVFFTVVFALFASSFLRVFNFFKYIYKKLIGKIIKIKKKNINLVDKENIVIRKDDL